MGAAGFLGAALSGAADARKPFLANRLQMQRDEALARIREKQMSQQQGFMANQADLNRGVQREGMEADATHRQKGYELQERGLDVQENAQNSLSEYRDATLAQNEQELMMKLTQLASSKKGFLTPKDAANTIKDLYSALGKNVSVDQLSKDSATLYGRWQQDFNIAQGVGGGFDRLPPPAQTPAYGPQ